MKEEYDKELSTEQREKMRKNLVYLGCFSIVMLFAGLTSGYLVSMGDSFWVKFDFPTPFYVSTALILLSSVILEIGIRKGRKGNLSIARAFILLTFILGLGFAWFQLKGYGALIDKGFNPVNNVIVTEGRYGDYYEIKVDGKYLEINANDYLIAGKKIPEAQKTEISNFARQFLKADTLVPASVKDYGKYTLLYKNEEVRFENGKMIAGDSTELLYTDLRRLSMFARHLADKRGDFFAKGELGKDFHIYFKGKELQYKDRKLYYNGKAFDGPMQLKINSASDTATSYLYIITVLHLLHVLAALIYLMRMSIRSFTGDITKNDYISVRMGAIFWHFLGALWVYLLLFLLFIH